MTKTQTDNGAPYMPPEWQALIDEPIPPEVQAIIDEPIPPEVQAIIDEPLTPAQRAQMMSEDELRDVLKKCDEDLEPLKSKLADDEKAIKAMLDSIEADPRVRSYLDGLGD